MQRKAMLSGVAVGIVVGAIGGQLLSAAPVGIRRTDLINTDLAGMEGQEMHFWAADIAPGGTTGKHAHPTQRFVYVLQGSVTVEAEGKPPRTFTAGQAYQEAPREVHNFRNTSATEPAKALGFQIAAKGQPLQY
jgi:glyoxylate utilization-related uncharacterized protein